MPGRSSLRLSLVTPKESTYLVGCTSVRTSFLPTLSGSCQYEKQANARLLWEKNRGPGSLFFSLRRPLNLLFSSCQPPPLSHFWHAAGMPASKVINDAVCSAAFIWACVGEPRFKLQISRVRARLSCTQKNHGRVT